MQLPPTILSVEKKVKEARERAKGKGASGVSSGAKKPLTGKMTKATKDSIISSAAEPQTSPNEMPSSDDREVGSSDESEGSVGEAEPEVELRASENKAMKSKDDKRLGETRRTGLQPPRTLETTLFDRLEKMYGPGIKRVLNVQYR